MPNNNAADTSPQQTLLRQITETLAQHGDDALRGAETIAAAARNWLDAGFADAEEIDDWLCARCFDPRHAQSLDAASHAQRARRLRRDHRL
jgi:hypothetical protein